MKFRWETKFKETEIEEIPEDWRVKQIKDVAKVTTGGTPSRKEPRYWNGKINWLKSQEVNDNYIYETEEKISEEGMRNSNAKIIYPPGTLVIAIYAAPTAGRVSILKTFTTINQALAALESENNEFLFYSFIGNRERLLLQASGAAQQNLNLELLKEFLIPYPPLPEQTRIATVLSYFDDLIGNKKRQNEILEKTAMAIFKNWFIDFEPFKDGEFVDSELGKIPKGWEVRRLGEIAIGFKGVSYNSSDICSEPQGNIFITLNNFIRGGGFKTEYIYYTGNKAKEQHKVKEGDLIIALTDITYEAKVVGAPAFVFLPEEYDFGIISLDCMKLQPNYEYLKLYLYLHLKQTQEENSTFANGVNVLHLNVRLFMQNKIIIFPPPSVLQKFHSLVEPLFQKIILNQKQIMLLRKIRDKLLPLLVFGKLRVEKI